MGRQAKAYIALVFIAITWGTTYLAIRMGVAHYPAFLFAAIRQFVSGIIIMAFGLAMSRKLDLSFNNIMHQMLIGFLLITLGNGFVTWGEKFIPSGVAALICSLMPLCAVMVNLSISKADNINLPILLGMVLGFAGVGIIFKDNVADLANKDYLLGMCATFLATSSWAIGSVINKRKKHQVNAIFNSGMQLFFGGMYLFIFSPLIDNYNHLDPFNPEALWPMIYLIVFGSVLAYTAYMYALKELPVGIASLYAYVNPLVAVVLGYFVLNEQLTWFTALAFVTIMTGVYLVNYGYRKQHKEKQISAQNNSGIGTVPLAQKQYK